MTLGVSTEQRYTRSHPCPICGGWESADRGQGKRCWGFRSGDEWARCVRDEHAGSLRREENSQAYVHRLHGRCNCGEQHGPPLNGGVRHSHSDGADILATYDYVDEQGALLYQVVRKTGKRFRQRKPSGDNGGWDWKVRSVRRVLYRLPELLSAPADAPIYLVEGEKDVDALVAEGLVATCNSGGAGKLLRDYAEHAQSVLKDRDVRIIADADDVGRLHATQVSRALTGHARSVKVIELPSHKDAHAFLCAGGTVRQIDELFSVVSAAPSPEPVSAVPPELRVLEPVSVTDLQPRLWMRSLVLNNDGTAAKAPANLALYLTHHEAWRECFRYNEFADRLVWGASGPRVDGFVSPPAGTDFSDDQWFYIAAWFAKQVGPRFEKNAVFDAMACAARAHAFNPWQDFLAKCADGWDGVPRLDQWLTTYLGAPPLPVNLRIGAMWLIGAVARGLNPGCKMDYVLVLEGGQGARKSTSLEVLFGDEFYLPDLPNIRDKDAMAALNGVACACIDELSAMKAVDEEAKKSFLSRRIDRFRPAYGRHFVMRPRHCVFAATTNVEQYLVDPTGNRRIWPAQTDVVHPIDIELLTADRPQLFGEAVVRYRSGEHWWPNQDETLALREAQANRDQRDEWDAHIEKYAATREWTTIGDCLSELGLERKDWKPADQHRVARALRRAGWKSVFTPRPPPDRPFRYWVRCVPA